VQVAREMLFILLAFRIIIHN